MNGESIPRDGKGKLGITVVETELVERESLPPNLTIYTTSGPSAPCLPASFAESPPLSRAAGLFKPFNTTIPQSHAARDTSRAAWLCLLGTILVQAVLFAFPLTFGVFQDFYAKDKQLSNATQSIWIGVLSTGVPFMGAPFMTTLCETCHPKKWRYYILFGWAICVASLLGAAFSSSLLALSLLQGMLYGVGLLIIDVPILMILNTWFVKRRGTAYGLLFGAADLIGFGATILAEYLLRRHGLKGALLTFGFLLLGLCGPSMYLLQPRQTHTHIPISKQDPEELTLTPLSRRATSNLCPEITTRYYTRPIFYIFTLANLFHSLAYYLPFMYLPSYTTSLGHPPSRGAYLLAAANFAQIFGEISFGQLSDRVNVHSLVLLGSLVSSIVALALWGLAHSFALLVAFALIFGSFGSGLISLWARMGTFFGQKDAQMIYSIMSFGRGLGSIISGPISTALLAADARRVPSEGGGSFGYGNGKFFGIVLFVGISMAISSLMGVIGLVAGWKYHELGRVDQKRIRKYQEIKPEP